MKTLIMLIMLVATGIHLMGQTKRSISYVYFHSTVIEDSRNGDPCAPGSPNCTGGGKTTSQITTGTGGCQRTVDVVNFDQGTFSRFYASPDVNLTTLQSIRYELKNKTRMNFVVYDFTVTRGGAGWANSTVNVQAGGVVDQTATVTVDNATGSVKIETPSIPMLFVSASDELEQIVTPTLTGGCPTPAPVSSDGGFNYDRAGCLPVSPITQILPGVVANNGQTAANGAMLYDIKFSSESADKGGWYLLDGRAISSITNESARKSAETKFAPATNLPDTRDKYTIAKDASAVAFAPSGATTTTITADNLPALHGSTTSAGTHSHALVTRNDDFNGGSLFPNDDYPSSFSNDNGITSWDSAISGGGHSHNVSVNTTSPNTPINILPPSINLYQFIYLGE